MGKAGNDVILTWPKPKGSKKEKDEYLALARHDEKSRHPENRMAGLD